MGLLSEASVATAAPRPPAPPPADDGGFDIAAHIAGSEPPPAEAPEPQAHGLAHPVFDDLDVGASAPPHHRHTVAELRGERHAHEVTAAHHEKVAKVHAAAQTRAVEHDGWSAVAEEKAKAQAKQVHAKAKQGAAAAHDAHEVTIESLKAELAHAIEEERRELGDQNARAKADLHARFEARRADLRNGAVSGAAGQAVRLAAVEQRSLQGEVLARRARLSAQVQDDAHVLGEGATAASQEQAQAAALEGEKLKAQAEGEAAKIVAKGDADAATLKEAAKREAAAAREAGDRKKWEARVAAANEAAAHPERLFQINSDGEVRAQMALAAGEEAAKKIEQKGEDSAAKTRLEAQRAATRVKAEAAQQAAGLLASAKSGGAAVGHAAAEAALREAEHASAAVATLEGDLAQAASQTQLATDGANLVAEGRIAAGLTALGKEEAAETARLDSELGLRLAEVDRKATTAEKKLEAGKAGDLERLERMVQKAEHDIDHASVEAAARIDAVRRRAMHKARAEVSRELRTIETAGKEALGAVHKAIAAARKQIATDEAAAEQQVAVDKQAGAQGVAEEAQRQAAALQAEAQKREAALAASVEAQEAALDQRRETSVAAMAGMKASLDKELAEDLTLDVAAAQKAAAGLDEAMDHWRTDKDGVYKALEIARTPAERRAVAAAYKLRTGRDLDADLDDKMSDAALRKAKALESGDPVRIAVANLELAQGGRLTHADGEAIHETLSAIKDPAMKAQVAKEFQRTTGLRLSTMLKDLSDDDRALVQGDVADMPALDDKLKVDPEKMRQVDQGAMREAAAQLRRAMDGIGTEEDAIHRTLKGKTPEEIETIKQLYRDHYHVELIDQLEGEMRGTDLKEATAALSGSPVDAAVASLENAMDGAGTDETKIHDTLEGIEDPETRRQVIEAFERQTGRALSTALESEMGGKDVEIAVTLTIADNDERRAQVAAVRLEAAAGVGDDRDPMGVDDDEIIKVLESAKTPAEREAMAKALAARPGGRSIESLLGRVKGHNHDVATALASGDAAAAAAARIDASTDHLFGAKEKEIYAQLEGKSKGEREAIIKAYNARYGQAQGGLDFDDMLEKSLDGLDREKAQLLARDGDLPAEFKLEYAMAGLGTDEDALKKALAGKTPGEINDIRAAYAKRFHKDLDAQLHRELSGRDEFQVGLLMEGEPQDAAGKLMRAHKLYAYERGDGEGSTGFGATMTDVFSDSGEDLDRGHQEMIALEKELKDKGVVRQRPDGTLEMVEGAKLDDADKHKLAVGYDWNRLDVESYQAAKDTVTTGLAEGVTVVVGGAVSVLTAGAAAPAVIAALSALAGGVAGMAVKRAMQGGAYGVEDMGLDAGKTLLQAATAGAMRAEFVMSKLDKVAGLLTGPGASAARRVLVSTLSGATGSALSSMVDAGFDGSARNFGEWLENVAAAAGEGALNGAIGGLVGHVHQASASQGLLGEAMGAPRSYLGAALTGVAGGLTGAVIPTAVSGLWDPSVFEGRGEDVLGRFGKSAAISGFQGATDAMMNMRGARAGEARAARAAAPDMPSEAHAEGLAHLRRLAGEFDVSDVRPVASGHAIEADGGPPLDRSRRGFDLSDVVAAEWRGRTEKQGRITDHAFGVAGEIAGRPMLGEGSPGAAAYDPSKRLPLGLTVDDVTAGRGPAPPAVELDRGFGTAVVAHDLATDMAAARARLPLEATATAEPSLRKQRLPLGMTRDEMYPNGIPAIPAEPARTVPAETRGQIEQGGQVRDVTGGVAGEIAGRPMLGDGSPGAAAYDPGKRLPAGLTVDDVTAGRGPAPPAVELDRGFGTAVVAHDLATDMAAARARLPLEATATSGPRKQRLPLGMTRDEMFPNGIPVTPAEPARPAAEIRGQIEQGGQVRDVKGGVVAGEILAPDAGETGLHTKEREVQQLTREEELAHLRAMQVASTPLARDTGRLDVAKQGPSDEHAETRARLARLKEQLAAEAPQRDAKLTAERKWNEDHLRTKAPADEPQEPAPHDRATRPMPAVEAPADAPTVPAHESASAALDEWAEREVQRVSAKHALLDAKVRGDVDVPRDRVHPRAQQLAEMKQATLERIATEKAELAARFEGRPEELKAALARRQQIETLFDTAEQTRMATPGTDPKALAALLDQLPEVGYRGPESIQELTRFAAETLGAPVDEVTLERIGGAGGEGIKGSTGAPVFRVRHNGETHILKVFPSQEEFGREMSSIARLRDADIQAPTVKGAAKAGKAAILVSTAAEGKPLDDLMIRAGQRAHGLSTRDTALADLHEAVEGIAATLAKLHTQASGAGHTVTHSYVGVYADLVRGDVRQLLSDRRFTELGIDIVGMSGIVEAAIRGFHEDPGAASLVHGDAHSGNMFYDAAQGTATLIDTPSLHWSVDQHGLPRGAAEFDTSTFLNSLENHGKHLGLLPSETALLQKAFSAAYARAGGATSTDGARNFFKVMPLVGAMRHALMELHTHQANPRNVAFLQEHIRGLARQLAELKIPATGGSASPAASAAPALDRSAATTAAVPALDRSAATTGVPAAPGTAGVDPVNPPQNPWAQNPWEKNPWERS